MHINNLSLSLLITYNTRLTSINQCNSLYKLFLLYKKIDVFLQYHCKLSCFPWFVWVVICLYTVVCVYYYTINSIEYQALPRSTRDLIHISFKNKKTRIIIVWFKKNVLKNLRLFSHKYYVYITYWKIARSLNPSTSFIQKYITFYTYMTFL